MSGLFLSVSKLLKRVYRPVDFQRRKIRVAAGTYLGSGVSIGRCTRINSASYITDCKIGSFCAIGGRLIVRSTNHSTGYLNMQDWTQKEIIGSDVSVVGLSKGDVEIGHGVWIGDSVIILSGVKIGNGAVIGAGSLVTRSVPEYAIAVGNPAKVIKYRFDSKVIDLARTINWWEWDNQKIRRNRELFEMDLESIDIAELEKLISNIR